MREYDLQKLSLTETRIINQPREEVVGVRCARGRDRVCSYGKHCICAADEELWLRVNEPDVQTQAVDYP